MHPDVYIVDSVMKSRKATRAFRSDAVSKKIVHDILDVARTAPSNSNTQPWNVHVLTGYPKQALSVLLGAAHAADSYPALQHFPDPLPDFCKPRQEMFGAHYYGALGVDKTDLAARARVTGRNFDFFGAPVGLIFTVDSRLKKYSWLDYGLFIQNIMLAARVRGLDACPQVSFVRYSSLIADFFELEPGFEVACGMSLGYADETSLLNRLPSCRAPVEQFAHFLGFDD
ncbi:MAG: nitroreductase [Pseudomonas sp.]|nr:nitroreductase [Pseudomonas sp.]